MIGHSRQYRDLSRLFTESSPIKDNKNLPSPRSGIKLPVTESEIFL